MTQSHVLDVTAEPVEKALSTVARATRYLSRGSVVVVRVADAEVRAELIAWCRWAGHVATVDADRAVVSVAVRAAM